MSCFRIVNSREAVKWPNQSNVTLDVAGFQAILQSCLVLNIQIVSYFKIREALSNYLVGAQIHATLYLINLKSCDFPDFAGHAFHANLGVIDSSLRPLFLDLVAP